MSWLDIFDTWGKLLTFTIGIAYHAFIFAVVITLVSLTLQWRFFVWVMAARRIDDGRIGKLRRLLRGGTRDAITLQDLIGIDEAKASIMEIVDFLQNPERFRAMGCRLPRGVLLVGAPGVGKTTLARAMANEAGVPFIGTDASTLDEVFFGIGAMRLRSLFKRCRKLAGRSRHRAALLFIDEIDALGSRNRGFTTVTGMASGNTTLNRLLTEMDGLDSTSNVIVVAATNYEEMLDPALLRPGRFDRKLYVPSPNLAARKRLFAHFLNAIKVRGGVNLDTLAEMTVNFSGAEVKAAVNEAALLSVRLRAPQVTQQHLETAIEIISQQTGDRRSVGGLAHARAGDLTVRLEHVVGAHEAKREARQLIDLLRNSAKLQETGARMPRGLLLLGPPGTGKTMLAKAIANEAGVPFYSVSGADFVELFVGMGAHRVRGVYSQARKHKAAVVFIDELDALGARTSTETAGGGGDREYNQTINQLLVELDGFGRSGVLTMAATNFEESLDPALLRPGRFDRRIYVPLPDADARRELLRLYLSRIKHEPDIDESALVAATLNFSGADIAHLVNAAALLAMQEGRGSATSDDLKEAVRTERGALSTRRVGSSSIVARITDLSVRLEDVLGIEDAKRDVLEVIDLLRAPERAATLGIVPPRGLLFAGAPGTGKTMLAQAMANHAAVPFYAMAGSDFQSMWRGEPARRIRAVYAQARRHPSAIVFIDEIDAIASVRSAGPGAIRDDNTTVDALLVELDGFGGSAVLTIGATNNPALLDPALIRPGRFDRTIAFTLPDVEGRRRVLASYLAKVNCDRNIDPGAVALATTGCSPAQLMNIVKEAGVLALRAGRDAVAQEDLTAGLERVALGAARRVVMTDGDRRVAAYHEAGHALATLLLDPRREVRKVSILGNVHGALGVTWGVAREERHLRGEQEYRTSVKIALAGMAAERLVFGEITDGGSADVRAVGELVRRMVCELGMGATRYLAEPASETMRHALDVEMRQISDDCYSEVETLLQRQRPALDVLAAALLAQESLSHDDVVRLVAV